MPSSNPLHDGWGILLGPAWRRDCGIRIGDTVTVALVPERPQLDDLADDLRAALDAEPQAKDFWLSIAQFYRRSYLRWIDATKRRPDVRAKRIAAVVAWLKEGIRERPQHELGHGEFAQDQDMRSRDHLL